jgi:hypothetical protein
MPIALVFSFVLMLIKILLLSLTGVSLLTTGHAQVAIPSSHPTPDSIALILGQWNGSFEGASSGKFELTLRQDSGSQQLSGQIVVMLSDGDRYSTKLKKAVFTNNQLVASYSEPDDGSNVTLTGQLAGSVLKGNWAVSDGQATGTWQAIHPIR